MLIILRLCLLEFGNFFLNFTAYHCNLTLTQSLVSFVIIGSEREDRFLFGVVVSGSSIQDYFRARESCLIDSAWLQNVTSHKEMSINEDHCTFLLSKMEVDPHLRMGQFHHILNAHL